MELAEMIGDDSINAQNIRSRGLSIYPDSVLFFNAFVGEEYKAKILFRNISATKIILRIAQPYKQCFQIDDDGKYHFLAPGLYIQRTVKFYCPNEKIQDSAFPIWVDNTNFEIPIRAKLAKPCLTVFPTTVNFGTINLGGRYVSKHLQVVNRGAEMSSFSIDFGQNLLELMAYPKIGTLKPYSSTTVRLDLAAFTPGEHFTQFWVKGAPPILIYVEVNVVMPFLQAVHPNMTTKFTLIDFPNTFFGSIRYETLVVRNMSSSTNTFVVLAEIEDTIMALEEIKSVEPDKWIHYKNFSVEPMEGSLAPFESRIFTVWFHPNLDIPDEGWMNEMASTEEYLCFFRVFRVDVREWITKGQIKSTNINDDDDEPQELRLCLHGSAERPQIGVLTSSFVFSNVPLGEKITRIIHLKNLSTSTVICRFVKSPGYEVSPTEKKIHGGKAVELIFTFMAKSLAKPKKYIEFDILCYKNSTSEEEKIVIGQLKIPVKATVVTSTIPSKPKFNMGITPMNVNEVGEHTDNIRFCDDVEIPPMIPFPNSRRGRPWLKSRALIAFPNDMPKSLRAKPTDKLKRSIFTGEQRYVPPINQDFTYSNAEYQKYKSNRNYYLEFLDTNYKERLKYMLDNDRETYYWMKPSDKSETRWYKTVALASVLEPAKKMLKKPSDLRVQESIPLSPKDLYNVRIMPKKLDFGQIPAEVDCTRKVAVENMNKFPVRVFLHVQKDSTGINDNWFIVGPQKRIYKNITLNVPTFGKYYSNASFVINNSDCFDMTIIADVVHRSLTITPREVHINFKTDDIFQVSWIPVRLVNTLYVPTSFEWKVPSGCPYQIEPISGTVPGQRDICCALYFESSLEQISNMFLTLNVEGGSSCELKICRLQEKAHSVYVLTQKKMLPPLSCYLFHCDNTYLCNAGFKDAAFTIVNPYPMEGVVVSPIAGIISSKSCLGIAVEFKMNRVEAFDLSLYIRVQFKSIIEIKYVGFVFFPKVEFTPMSLELWNIPCHSLTTYNILVENNGYSAVNIKFRMRDEYPQIKISEHKKAALPSIEDSDEFLLQPGTNKDLFLHFYPEIFATYEFLLPVVYNHHIGPPILHIDSSQNPLSYVKSAASDNKIMRKIDLSFQPIMTSTRIDVSVGRSFVAFSTWKILFSLPCKNCSQRRFLSIKNLRKEAIEVYFDPKLIVQNYSFFILNMPKDGVYKLVPNGETKLKVIFSPEADITHELEIPVFVREYSTTMPYNYLKLSGNLRTSSVSVSESLINFMPVPVGVSVERVIKVTAESQSKDTKLYVKLKRMLGIFQDEAIIEFSFPKGNFIPAYDPVGNRDPTVIPVVLRFRSKKTISQQGCYVFSDDCEGSCEVNFTVCADNSIMSCYHFLLLCQQGKKSDSRKSCEKKNTEEDISEICNLKVGDLSDENLPTKLLEDLLDFPKFPAVSSETDYAKNMRRVVRCIETWIFEQGFSGSFRMKVGEHIAFSRGIIAGQKKPQQEFVKSIIDLLYSFVGRDLFLEYQLPIVVPEENIERINYSLSIFRQVLKFLNVQGGNVSHIFPVYLLDYDDYCDHLNDLKLRSTEQKIKGMHYEDVFEANCSKKRFLSFVEFDRYNKQAWLDIYLQLHRTVVESGIPFLPEYYRCLNTWSSVSKISNETDSILAMSYRTVEKGDKILMDWLNLVYNQARNNHPELNIGIRTISDVVEDLEDAVVLSVVTINYCPYLIDDYFSDFFFYPVDAVQFHHNAAQLCIAWSVIKIGITVKPDDFHQLNPVFMMILVSHLYQVLRSYIPDKTIEFLASLTSSVSRKLTLTNQNETMIGYSLRIIGDYSKVFNVENSRMNIFIPPRSSAKISLTFSAKKLTPVKATLLLCGTCVPNGYVENIVLTLYGDPYNLLVSREFTIISPIMKPTFIIGKISSPYETEAEFELWFADEEPKPGSLNIQPWSEVKKLKLPRTLFLSYDKLVVPPSSEPPAALSITAACFTRSILHFWVVFKNDEVGDFIVRITLKPKVEVPSLIVKVPMPNGLCTGYPGSLCSTHCSRLLSVTIPCRNVRLWNTVKTMLLLTMQNKGMSFWEEHYETRIGLDLMKWLLGKAAKTVAKEISFIFESKVKYKVTSLSPHVQVQEFLEIEDIHSRDFVELAVHICCRIYSDFCSDILLESESGQEVRLYRVRFTGESNTAALCPEENCRKGCDFQTEIPLDACDIYNTTAKRDSFKKR